MKELIPYDDPNYGLDESWARFYPYAIDVRRGQTAKLALRIMNHSPVPRTFRAGLRLPEGWIARAVSPHPIRINARNEGAMEMTIAVPPTAPAGLHLLTADIAWDDWELRDWTEAMVTVANAPNPDL